MTGSKWYNYPKADYRRDKPCRDIPITIIVALYGVAVTMSIYILVKP
jgi:hypothetical protein